MSYFTMIVYFLVTPLLCGALGPVSLALARACGSWSSAPCGRFGSRSSQTLSGPGVRVWPFPRSVSDPDFPAAFAAAPGSPVGRDGHPPRTHHTHPSFLLSFLSPPYRLERSSSPTPTRSRDHYAAITYLAIRVYLIYTATVTHSSCTSIRSPSKLSSRSPSPSHAFFLPHPPIPVPSSLRSGRFGSRSSQTLSGPGVRVWPFPRSVSDPDFPAAFAAAPGSPVGRDGHPPRTHHTHPSFLLSFLSPPYRLERSSSPTPTRSRDHYAAITYLASAPPVSRLATPALTRRF
ncbi:hypothetical protein GGX14DRAFT_579801 [Mycena pura]|uniref:Secreted protein n=1 Tax=Mycena pura TaxID=153505 RepID=A0AAD6UM32_9AGAR|nr:hypothetical protein GGX14DRAFT_579801 [Mycena pura]